MLTYKEMKIRVRGDGITSFNWRNDDENGKTINYRSFYAPTEDWLKFLSTDREHRDFVIMSDGYYVLQRMMENWYFVSLERLMGSTSHGEDEMKMRTCVMRMPYRVRERLAQLITNRKNRLEKEGDEEVINIDYETRKTWDGLYGVGKGKVKFEFSTDEQRHKFEACLAKYKDRDDEEAKSFRQSVEALENMARNTTSCSTDVGIVKIGPDWAGFTFHAGGLMGGLIHHDRDEDDNGGNWSLHT